MAEGVKATSCGSEKGEKMKHTALVNPTIKGTRVFLVVLSLAMHGGPIFAQEFPGSGSATEKALQERLKSGIPAAKVGEEVIAVEEVEQALSVQLAQIARQRYALLTQKLQQLIGERLLAQEAKKRGMSVEQLLRTEVYSNASEVTDAEVTAFMTQNRARLPQGDEAELRVKVWDYLRSQKVNQQRQGYIRNLRAQTNVTIYLDEPATDRVHIRADKGFTRGPKDAPVTIVEFADFQCPFCKSILPTINQLMDKYPGKVKWVFRDFPISDLHPTAPKAHEAARCAAEQGMFWEYHDFLYERSPRHSLEELKQYAQELKLDGSAFAQCLDSGKYQAEINGDIQEGTRLGVSATPTFFINGRVLVGAHPLTAFEKLIEGDLAKKAAN